ncbi:MAG TPA: hypothetical protein VJL90_11615 [Pseudorhodoplanes sp.]|jgi:hypothetical protein|nr:hypothetical protein [Pseudorhodoplanes sp.]
MARKPTKYVGFVLFDVFYEDGSQRSNRKVPADALGGIDGDEPARAIIAEQDREIAEKSGLAPMVIKSLHRSGEKPKTAMGAALRASRGGRHP